MVHLVEERERDDVVVVVRLLDAKGRPVTDACVDALRLDVEHPNDDGFLIRELTDSSGCAHFRELPARPLRFVAFSDVFPYSPLDVDLSAGAPQEIELHLPGGVMEGTIRFPDGSPARVELHLEFEPGREHGWRSGWPRVNSDPDGRFRIQGLDDGVFSIYLCTDGLRLVQGPRTFRAGATCEWVVAKDDGSVLPTSLEVVDQKDSNPIEGIVEVMIDREWIEFDAVEGRPGVYACVDLVDPGSYLVRVKSVGFLDVQVPDVALGGTGPTRVAVRREEGAILDGLVRADDGQPVPYALVSTGEQRCEAEEDGRFRLLGLPDGAVDVEIRGSYVLTSVRTVNLSRRAPTRVEWRLPPAGVVALLIPISSVPDPSIGFQVRARHADTGTERTENWILGPWLKDLKREESDGAWVTAASLGGLEPGTWQIEVQWAGKKCPAVEVTVTGLETTEIRLAPP